MRGYYEVERLEKEGVALKVQVKKLKEMVKELLECVSDCPDCGLTQPCKVKEELRKLLDE